MYRQRSVPCRKIEFKNTSSDQPPMLLPTSKLYTAQFPRRRSTSLHATRAVSPTIPVMQDISAGAPRLLYTYPNPSRSPSPFRGRSCAPSISDLIRNYEPSEVEKKMDSVTDYLGRGVNEYIIQFDRILWNKLACKVCSDRTGRVIPRRPKGLFFGPPGREWPGACICEDGV